MTTGEWLSRGLALHQAGRLAEAETIYRQILSGAPEHADALHLLGVLAGQRDQFETAIGLISRAIARDPNHGQYHCNIAEMYRKTGKLDLALSHGRRAVQLNPRLIEAWIILGVTLVDENRVDEAIGAYRRAIEIQADCFAAHLNLGNALKQKGQFAEAILEFQRAVGLSPDSAVARFNLGNTFLEAGRVEDAIAEFRRAVELDPNEAGGHRNLGYALMEAGRIDEAIGEYRRAIEIQPGFAEAYCNWGVALAAQGKLDEALAIYRRAIEINPDYAEAHSNIGNALVDKGNVKEGISAIHRAIELKPGVALAHYNLGNALREDGRIDEAVAAYDEAIRLKPEYAQAHFNRALIFLRSGDYLNGWPGYEWRARAEPMFIFAPGSFPQPQWDGGDLRGRTILLHAEQGYGDTLQAIRFVPLVVERGGRVILCCQPALKRLFADLPGVQRIMVPGEPVPAIDLHCPLMSLPKALSIEVSSIPNRVPYLTADPVAAEGWKRRMSDTGSKLKVGLVWAGSATHSLDRTRSIEAGRFSPLGTIATVHLFSLQKGEPANCSALAELHMTDWTSDLHDFADTAALIANLDLVISVDTAVAHLAGAMGKKVWVLVSNRPDWRWLLDREDSPWYPTARLFRQTSRADWNAVIQKVLGALQEL